MTVELLNAGVAVQVVPPSRLRQMPPSAAPCTAASMTWGERGSKARAETWLPEKPTTSHWPPHSLDRKRKLDAAAQTIRGVAGAKTTWAVVLVNGVSRRRHEIPPSRLSRSGAPLAART